VFSEIFSKCTLGKFWDLNFELLFALVQGQKWKIEGVKKSSGGWEEKNSKHQTQAQEMVDQKYKKTYPILWTKRKIISYSFDD
jgi:hypothetical protein